MIHQFKMHGTNIVLDVNSNSVHVLDDSADEVLRYYSEIRGSDEETPRISDYKMLLEDKFSGMYERKNIEEIIEELSRLEEEGLLFSEEVDIDGALSFLNTGVIKSLCLNISHDCNMRCGYCFASTGNYGTERVLMDSETGCKAIDFLIGHSAGRRNLEVDFFGGEPLMNFEAVTEIIRYARSLEDKHGKHFRFTITTNGLLLDEKKMKIIDELFDNVVLSLDGREDINDRMRRLPDGSGTYKHIMPKIKEMVRIRGDRDHYVRGTFTSHNLDFMKDALFLAAEGFKSISLEPVTAPEKKSYSITKSHLPAIFREYENLAEEYLRMKEEGRGFGFFHFNIDLEQGPCLAKRVKGCGAGCEYAAVAPNGDIYPCHQFVGKEEYKLGSLNEKDLNRKIMDEFKNNNIAAKEACSHCWAKFHCSGGCAANALEANGDIHKPYEIGCELEKKRLECAIWLKTQEGAER